MHVLMIDDDADMRLLAGFVLEAAGHRVTFAESGREGIAAAAQRFDLVVLDYRLGDMTGADVLPALLARHPDRPVVIMTGAEDPAVTAALRAGGAADVVTKPIDPEALVPRLERIVSGRTENAD